MINRENWLMLKKYLTYREEVEQISAASARLEESWLRYVLEWADEQPLSKAPRIKPPFPAYVLASRRDGESGQLSKAYVRKIISAARRFFEWLRLHESGYGSLTLVYLDTLQVPRMDETPEKREVVSIEEIWEMAQADVESLRDMRIRAAAVFLFLSGMRVTAFTTLPLRAVDISGRTVKQWPGLGVRTKNGKHATTYLLPIQGLLDRVREWDSLLRSHGLPADAPWFAALLPTTGELDPDARIEDVGEHRHAKVRRDLREWCNRVGLLYYSPHKFRHGHATYSLEQANTVSDYKAVSQNLMHSDLKVTDSIYAVLSDDDVRGRISSLREDKETGEEEDLKAMIRRLSVEISELKEALGDRGFGTNTLTHR